MADAALIGCVFLRLFPVLDYVAGPEEDFLHDVAPLRLLPQEKLEIHPEMLEFLLLGVPHDGLRFPILLE